MFLRGENVGVCVKVFFFFFILKRELKNKSVYGIEIGVGKVSVGRRIIFDVKLIFRIYVV